MCGSSLAVRSRGAVEIPGEELVLVPRKPKKSGEKPPGAAMMAKLTSHVRSFDELLNVVLYSATKGELDRAMWEAPGQAHQLRPIRRNSNAFLPESW